MNEDNLLGKLDEIRRIRGLPRFDPTVIQGEGPPPPAFDPDLDAPFPSVEPNFDTGHIDAENTTLREPSRLVARGREDMLDEIVSGDPMILPSPLVALGSTPPVWDKIPDGLVVMNDAASYDGQAVKLSDEDFAAIGAIVLKALERRIKEQHRELKARVEVRRRASPIVSHGQSNGPDATVGAAPKRKRGRPRKDRTNAEGNQEAQRG